MKIDDFLEWLEEQRRIQIGSLDEWSIEFVTEGYYIKVNGGEYSGSNPLSYCEHIKEYTEVSVSIYQRGEYPSEEKMEEFNKPLVVGEYTINISTTFFPHRALLPSHEKFLKDQPWAPKFSWKDGSWAPTALLSLHELYDVVKYLKKLDGLIAFT